MARGEARGQRPPSEPGGIAGKGVAMIRVGVVLAAVFGVAWSHPAYAQAARVGVAAAVNPEARGAPPGAAQRVIQVGLEMQRNERVTTGPQGRTQMLFLDGSALTVGPSSEVVLDEFVYDPAAESGKIALSAARGLFRVVGGKISKTEAITIRTPTALIGVRGGIAVVEVGQSTRAQFLFGEQMTVEAGGVVREVGRPGFEVTVGPNAAPSAPAPLTEQSVSLGGFEGVSGSTGGATQAPTDENVASTQITALGSSNAPAAVVLGQATAAAPLSTLLPNQAVEQERADSSQTAATDMASRQFGTNFVYGGRLYIDPPFTTFDFDTLFTTRDPARNVAYSSGRLQDGRFRAQIGGQTIDLPLPSASFSFGSANTPFGVVSGRGFVAPDGAFFHYLLAAADGRAASVFGGVPFAPTGPSARVSAFTLTPGFPGDHAIPFIPAAFGGNFGGASISPLYSANREPNEPALPAEGRISSVFGAIAIEGQGPSQRSTMTAFTGNTFMDPALGKFLLSGFARGSTRMSSSSLILRHGAGGSSAPDANGDSFFGLNSVDYFVLDSDFYPTAQSTPRQSAAGFAQPFENTAVSNEFFQTQYGARQAVPTGVGASRTSRTLNGYTAGIAEQRTGFMGSTPQFESMLFANSNNSPLDVQVVTRADLNRVRSTFLLSEIGDMEMLSVEFGDLAGGGARSAFIDDRIFGMRESASRPWLDNASLSGAATGSLLTSAFFTNTSAVPSGVSLCGCQHLVWGFWNGDQRPPSGPERTRTHFAPFVVGELPSAASIPTAGSASYVGHVAANIDNAGVQFIAFGSFGQTWNFGSRSGTVTIGNLDGAAYAGTISSNDGRDFSGAISGAGRSGGLVGSFFSGAGDPAAATGANFYVTSGGPAPYKASGIALGQRQ